MKRAIVMALLGAVLLCLALIFADARALNVADLFTSTAELNRTEAAKIRDRAALVEVESRARIDLERLNTDAEMKRFVLDQARQAGAAQGRASMFGGVSIMVSAVAAGLFFFARKIAAQAAAAESRMTEIRLRLSDMQHAGRLSAGQAAEILTGLKQLTTL